MEKNEIGECLSLRIGGFKGQLSKRENQNTDFKNTQNAIIRGRGIFLKGHGIGHSISNITRSLRGMEDLKSPLHLAVNSNTVSIGGGCRTQAPTSGL